MPLELASDRLSRSAKAADAMLAHFDTLPAALQARIDAQLHDIDQTLIDPAGLPFRPWYRNLIYAPGRFTGYGAKTLPGVREAIEERRDADAVAYVARTATVLNAYADRLDKAVAVAGK
jgi:N-acetylated-alpha-linked acidic dipeptidase